MSLWNIWNVWNIWMNCYVMFQIYALCTQVCRKWHQIIIQKGVWYWNWKLVWNWSNTDNSSGSHAAIVAPGRTVIVAVVVVVVLVTVNWQHRQGGDLSMLWLTCVSFNRAPVSKRPHVHFIVIWKLFIF